MMRELDAADSNEASYWPDYEDAPADVWADTWMNLCRVAGVVVAAQAVEAGKAAFRAAVSEADQDAIRHAQRQAIVRFMLQARSLSACPELAYFVACWQLADDDGDNEQSQTAVGKEFGKTRAAVSKRVNDIRLMLRTGDNVARGQKSRAAARTYQLRQLVIGATRKRIDFTNQQQETNTLWRSTANK
jgi:hypothetical protein